MTRVALKLQSAQRVREIVQAECAGYWYHFETYATDPQEHGHEWRFSGELGIGGKLHIDGHRGVYVTAYPEDLTPERKAKIDCVNERLAGLALKWVRR
jgi:hypothetical protein